MVEASEEKIGTLADAVTLLCYRYDPMTGKYGVAIMRAIRTGAVITVAGLGTFILMMVRRDRRLAPVPLTASPSPGTPGEGGGEGLISSARREEAPHPNPLPRVPGRGDQTEQT
jgi:hypothetical protein